MTRLLASKRPGRRAPAAWLRLSVRPHLRELLAAAPLGSVDPHVDPDDVFDLVLGTVLARVLVPDEIRRPPPSSEQSTSSSETCRRSPIVT